MKLTQRRQTPSSSVAALSSPGLCPADRHRSVSLPAYAPVRECGHDQELRLARRNPAARLQHAPRDNRFDASAM